MAEGDNRQGGADRTVDIKPPQSESQLIFSFDDIMLTPEFTYFYHVTRNLLCDRFCIFNFVAV